MAMHMLGGWGWETVRCPSLLRTHTSCATLVQFLNLSAYCHFLICDMGIQSWLRKTIAHPLATDCVLRVKRCRWCIWTILINSHNGFYHSLVCPASPPRLQHPQPVLTRVPDWHKHLPSAGCHKQSTVIAQNVSVLRWLSILRQRGSCSQHNTLVSGRVSESNTWDFWSKTCDCPP